MSLSTILNKAGQTEPDSPSSRSHAASSSPSSSSYNRKLSSTASPGVLLTSPVSVYSDRMTPASHASRQHVQVQPDYVTTEFVRARPKGVVNFPPFEHHLDTRARRAVQAFGIYPFGNIEEYSRHIPYASGKKDFHEKTGRESFEVFQYVYRLPGEPTEYHVMWDYNIGLVRMTPFFKCCKYSKTTPAKMLNSNPGLRDITHSITGGSIMAQGYWMPYSCAKAVCATFCYHISGALIPLFGPDFPNECISPQSSDFGRMVINPALVVDATQEAEEMRRLYATDGGPRDTARYSSVPSHEHRPLGQPYLQQPTGHPASVYGPPRAPPSEYPAGGRPRSNRSASSGSSERSSPAARHYQPAQPGRLARGGPAPATLASPMPCERLPTVAQLTSLPLPTPSWILPPLAEHGHPHNHQQLKTMQVAASRQPVSRSGASITAAAGGCGKLENYKLSNDSKPSRQSLLDRPQMGSAAAASAAASAAAAADSPAAPPFTPQRRPFAPGPAPRHVHGYNNNNNNNNNSRSSNSFGSRYPPAQHSTRYGSASSYERVYSPKDTQGKEEDDEHRADAVVAEQNEETMTMNEQSRFESAICCPPPPVIRTPLMTIKCRQQQHQQEPSQTTAAERDRPLRPDTAPGILTRSRRRQRTATAQAARAEQVPSRCLPGCTGTQPWSTTEMDAAELLVRFRSARSQGQDDSEDGERDLEHSPSMEEGDETEGGGGPTGRYHPGRDRRHPHPHDWTDRHKGRFAAAVSTMACEEKSKRKHKRRRD